MDSLGEIVVFWDSGVSDFQKIEIISHEVSLSENIYFICHFLLQHHFGEIG
jgi:hypothetical protein